MVAVCAEHPFFSYDDWFIGTTPMDGGIPEMAAQRSRRVPLQRPRQRRAQLFDEHPGRIACRHHRAGRPSAPAPGFLEGFAQLCTDARRRARVRRDDHGLPLGPPAAARSYYGVAPDLSTFGKAIANGFSLSALCRATRHHALGRSRARRRRVFLLSTTHGARDALPSRRRSPRWRSTSASQSSSICTGSAAG